MMATLAVHVVHLFGVAEPVVDAVDPHNFLTLGAMAPTGRALKWLIEVVSSMPQVEVKRMPISLGIRRLAEQTQNLRFLFIPPQRLRLAPKPVHAAQRRPQLSVNTCCVITELFHALDKSIGSANTPALGTLKRRGEEVAVECFNVESKALATIEGAASE